MTAASAAVITNGVVTNMIVVDVNADRETDFELPGSEVVVLEDGSLVTNGYLYSNGEFTAPPEEEPTPEE